MSKETIKNLIELVPDSEIDLLYQLIIKFIPEDKATEEEIKAFEEAKKDRQENGTIKHGDIDWD